MTTVPLNRPSTAAPMAAPRPAAAAGPSLDPVKLLIKYLPHFVGAVIVGGIFGIAAHFGLRFTFPVYNSYVTYGVQPVTEKVTETTTAGQEDELQRFMNTEVQYMLSERILGAAVASPRMATEARSWAAKFSKRSTLPDGQTVMRVDPGDGLEDLLGRVTARVIPETTFIKLSVWWHDKEDVAGLVNVVREEYEKDFNFRANLQNNSSQAALASTIRDYRTNITNLQTQRDRVLQENSIDSLDQRLNEAQRELDLAMTSLTDIRNSIGATQVALDEMRRQRESPAGITYDASIREEVEANPLMVNLKREHNGLETALAGLREQFGPSHRDVRSLQARVNGSLQQIDATREKLLADRFAAREEALRQGLAQTQKQEADLTKVIEDAKSRAARLTQVKVTIDDYQSQINRFTESLINTEDQLKQLISVVASGAGVRVTVAEAPKVPTEVMFPKIWYMVPAGIALILGLTVGVVVLFELVDQRIKGPSDVALIPRTRVLGVIPHAQESPDKTEDVETVFRDQPRGVIAESFRQLRATAGKRLQSGGHRTLLVASVMPRSGTTTVVSNLALGFAALGQRTLVIDANFRRPRMHSVLKVSDAPGLGDVLAGETTLEAAAQPTATDHLSVLAAGSAANRVYERLSSGAMADLLSRASGAYDIVLVDVAPAIVSGDALALAARCDAVALVVRAYQEKRGMVARIRNELAETKGQFIGVIVNAVRPTAGGYMRRNIKVAHEYQNHKNA